MQCRAHEGVTGTELRKHDFSYRPTSFILKTKSRRTPIAYSKNKFAFNLCLLSLDDNDAEKLRCLSAGGRTTNRAASPKSLWGRKLPGFARRILADR
jgi:hypothetical protein